MNTLSAGQLSEFTKKSGPLLVRSISHSVKIGLSTIGCTKFYESFRTFFGIDPLWCHENSFTAEMSYVSA